MKQASKKTQSVNLIDRAKFRDQLSDQDWANVFEELIDRDMIDLRDEFIREKIFFKDAEDLENIFSKHEEDNLSCIHRY